MAHALESGDVGLPLEQPQTQIDSTKLNQFRATEAQPKTQNSSSAQQFLPALDLKLSSAKSATPSATDAVSTVSSAGNIGSTVSEQGLFQSAVALNALAENKDLAFKLTGGSGTITRENIDNALLIDQTLRSQKGSSPIGPEQFLNPADRQRLLELRNNWSGIAASGALDANQLSKFSSQSLTESLGKEAAQAIIKSALSAGTAGIAVGRIGSGGVASGDGHGGVRGPGSVIGQRSNPEGGHGSDGTPGKAQGTGGKTEGISGAAEGKLSPMVVGLIGGAIAGMQALVKENKSPYAKQNTALGTDEVKEAGETIFDKIDEDKDGFLSKQELGKAVSQKKFEGQEAQVVATLYKHVDKLQMLSDDEFFDDNDGITKKDLEKFDSLDAVKRREVVGLSGYDAWMAKNFDNVDKDKNGFLTKAELNKALENKNLTADEKRILTHVRDHSNKIQEASDDEILWENDGVTKKDLEKHWKNQWESDSAKLIGSLSWIMHRTSTSQQSGVSRELFAKNNPTESIKPEAVKQGTIGDCYMLAALAGVARQNPDTIKNMIKDNQNGTYTVTFPGDKAHPITVTAPTDAEMGLYNGGTQYGTWAIIIEKAYGKYQQKYHGKGGITPSEGGDGGGRTEAANKLLTGKESNVLSVQKTSEKDLATAMQDAFASRPPKEITTHIHGNKGKNGKSAAGYPNGHAYTIVGFIPDGKGGGEVLVRNPWGGQDGTTNGVSRLSVADFKKNFSDVVISKK